MAKTPTIISYELHNEKNSHPGFSIDCVILTFHKGKLKVLLREFGTEDYRALLGGFVFNDESADEAASRVLECYTGMKEVYLKQFALFSDPNRTDLKQNRDFIKKHASTVNNGKWLLRRFISMGYFALINYDKTREILHKESDLKWYDVKNLPHMYSDHEHIIKTALETIRLLLPVIPIGYELLPEKFTIFEMRKIYEIVLNKKLDRRNFQRKILSEGKVVQLDERKPGKAYNAPILYQFQMPDVDDYFLRDSKE